MQFLMEHPEGRKVLDEVLGEGWKNACPAAARHVITLRDSLAYMGIPSETASDLEARLNAIPNT
jgi:hypothetical protein